MRTSRGTASGFTPVVEKYRSTRNVVGPTTSSVLTICSRKPATMEAIAMTVAIPITTPSTVSADRSLLARSWSRAMRQPSRTEWSGPGHLFLAQRFDRVEPRGAMRGVDAERDPYDDAERQRNADGPRRDARRQW